MDRKRLLLQPSIRTSEVGRFLTTLSPLKKQDIVDIKYSDISEEDKELARNYLKVIGFFNHE